jgi:hypothetical protein
MKKSEFISATELPAHEIEALARCFFPYIREYYETEEGREAFEKWKRVQKSKTPDTE